MSTARAAWLQARACMLACGANYRFNRSSASACRARSSRARSSKSLSGRRITSKCTSGRQSPPAGFAWLVPFRRDGASYARVGLMCEQPRHARPSRSFAARIRTRFGVIAPPWPEPRLKILPLGARGSRPSRNRVARRRRRGRTRQADHRRRHLLQPDQRQLAADVLDEALRDDRLTATRLREYERRWRARLGAEIRAGWRSARWRSRAERPRHRRRGRARPRRRHRAAAEADRRFQLARRVGPFAASQSVIPPVVFSSSGADAAVDPIRASPPRDLLERGHYARKQIFSRNASWPGAMAAGSRSRASWFRAGRAAAARLRLRRRDVRRDGPRQFRETVGADVDAEQVRGCGRAAGHASGVRFVSMTRCAIRFTARARTSSPAWRCSSTVRRTSSQQVLDDLARLSRPDGIVVISVPIEIGPTLAVKQLVRAVAAVERPRRVRAPRALPAVGVPSHGAGGRNLGNRAARNRRDHAQRHDRAFPRSQGVQLARPRTAHRGSVLPLSGGCIHRCR